MKTNKLVIEVTRPDQILIIMRGIPGSGKSTRSKELVKSGQIHSTDTLIEEKGNYREFFEKMITSKNFMALGWMHKKNLKNATQAVTDGVSPIIIDNTNIKHADAKAYVEMALELGLSDDNIKFEDVGTAGLDAETLADRNTHGVPLDKIISMMASHKAQGEITLDSVLKRKSMQKKVSNISYSCVLLDKVSQNTLLEHKFPIDIPTDWKKFAHHMTITLGELKDKSDIGKKVILQVTAVGKSDMAMAVKVNGFESKNDIPHITLAIEPNDGKPVMSNLITKWQDIKPFIVTGVVSEIEYSK